MKSILITGASGFIGSFIVEEAIRRGMDVWAGVRASSSRRYLQHPAIHFIELDMSSQERLAQQLKAYRDGSGPSDTATNSRSQADPCSGKHKPSNPLIDTATDGSKAQGPLPAEHRLSSNGHCPLSWDFVVHCAGVTKCADPADFDRVNHLQTLRLAQTLRDLGMMPRQFIFLSTLSIFGPIHDHDFQPICLDDEPHPNTAYGLSKLHAEQALASIDDLPYVFLRPTGVYGPRERDYFLAMQSIARHVDFAAGCTRQDLTFVHVSDVVQAVFLAIDRGVTRRAYILSDGKVYPTRAFSNLVRRELGQPWVLHFACPLGLLRVISSLAGWWAARRGRSSTLNRDKYRIMRQRSWQCDIDPAVRELGYRPTYDLEKGVRQTVAWYRQHGWL